MVLSWDKQKNTTYNGFYIVFKSIRHSFKMSFYKILEEGCILISPSGMPLTRPEFGQFPIKMLKKIIRRCRKTQNNYLQSYPPVNFRPVFTVLSASPVHPFKYK
jgi:hypothetical protein